MKQSAILSILVLCCFNIVLGQEIQSEEENNFKPTLGIGAGMLTFYGDVSKGQQSNGALSSRVAFDLRITQPINSYLNGSFYFMQGKTGANELSLTRNVNFESIISMWGIDLAYNFQHLLPGYRLIQPYVSVGIETFEFLSKTDIKDANGNFYHYWNDGTIRNIDQTSENSAQAIRLQRDYTYETDIRGLDADNFGEYPERSISIPIGIGANMVLTDNISFKVGTTLHFTGTDFIDGISGNSIGNRAGTPSNDKFLFTSFSLNYNLNNSFGSHKSGLPLPKLPSSDLLAYDDTDLDGVIDYLDLCAGTPEGVEVDENGCPLETTDKDGIADYLDQEAESEDSMAVNLAGMTMTDEMILNMYQRYMDSTGQFGSPMQTLHYEHFSDPNLGGLKGKKYMVQLGAFKGGLPTDVAEQLLTIPDVQTWEENGVTYLAVGSYDNLPDAIKRQLDLLEQGFGNTALLSKEPTGFINKVSDTEKDKHNITSTTLNDPNNQAVYRVQIGAFKSKLSDDIFTEVPNLIILPFSDGITRYFSGSFTSFKDAATAKVDLLMAGFQGAFVVVFKDGKRMAIGSSTGATMVSNSVAIEESNANRSLVKEELIYFTVQLGVYKDNVPSELLEILVKLENVKRDKTPEGLTRYFSGKFDNFEAAEKYQNELAAKGFDEVYVVGRFKNKTITAQEANELLKR